MPLRWAQDRFFPGPERIGLHAAQVSHVSRLWPAAGCSGKGSPVGPDASSPWSLLWRAPNECREAIFSPFLFSF